MKLPLVAVYCILLLNILQYLVCMAIIVKDLHCSSNNLYSVNCSWVLPVDNPTQTGRMTKLKVCLDASFSCNYKSKHFMDVECYPTFIQDNRTCCAVDLIQLKNTTYPNHGPSSHWQALKFAVFANDSRVSPYETFNRKYDAIPTVSPRDIIIRAMDHEAFSVSWMCPVRWSVNITDIWKQDISGGILEYQLNYTNEDRWETMDVGKKRRATISNIGAYTTSCIKLRTRNSKRNSKRYGPNSWSNWSEPVCERTKEGVPATVTGLKVNKFVYSKTSDNVSTTIMWDALDKSQWKGGSMTYFINVCDILDLFCPCQNESTTINNIKIDLQSNKSYVINITAFNGRNPSYFTLEYHIPQRHVMIKSLPAQARATVGSDLVGSNDLVITLLVVLVIGVILVTLVLRHYYRSEECSREFNIKPLPNLNQGDTTSLLNNNGPMKFRVVTPEVFDELSSNEGQYINLGEQNIQTMNAHVDRARSASLPSVTILHEPVNTGDEEQHDNLGEPNMQQLDEDTETLNHTNHIGNPNPKGACKESLYVTHSSVPQRGFKLHSPTSVNTNGASFSSHYVKSTVAPYSRMATFDVCNTEGVHMMQKDTASLSGSSICPYVSHSKISQQDFASFTMVSTDVIDTTRPPTLSSTVDLSAHVSKTVHDVFKMAQTSTSKCSESLQSPYVPLTSSAIACPHSVNTNTFFLSDSQNSSVTTSTSVKCPSVLETHSTQVFSLEDTDVFATATEAFHETSSFPKSSARKATFNIPISKRSTPVSTVNVFQSDAYENSISSQESNHATFTSERDNNNSVKPDESYVKAAEMFQSSISEKIASSDGDCSSLLPQCIPMSLIKSPSSLNVPSVLEFRSCTDESSPTAVPCTPVQFNIEGIEQQSLSLLASDKQEESLNQKIPDANIRSLNSTDHNPGDYLRHSAALGNSNSNNAYDVNGYIAASEQIQTEYANINSNNVANVTQSNLPLSSTGTEVDRKMYQNMHEPREKTQPYGAKQEELEHKETIKMLETTVREVSVLSSPPSQKAFDVDGKSVNYDPSHTYLAPRKGEREHLLPAVSDDAPCMYDFET